MKTFRTLPAGSSARGTPAFRRALRRHPVFTFLLVLTAVGQTGCMSCGGGCYAPSPCLAKIGRVSERVFIQPWRNIFAGKGPCCGSDLGVPSAPVLQYGTPAVVTPPPISVPSGAGSTTVVPNETVTPSLEPIPSGERAPSASPGPAPTGSGVDSTPSQGSTSTNSRANYEAYRSLYRDGSSRVSNSNKTPAAKRPESTPRSAQGSSSPVASKADSSPLDNLPPLNLNLEIPEIETTPPASPVTPREAGPSAKAGPAASAESLTDQAARPVYGDVSVAPGIRHFAGLEAKLAGGSLPTTTGLDWLVEKGYKTIVDLTEDTDRSPAFIGEVAKRGIRYIPLPITAKTIDADHVARFHFEISVADARPLYFCDISGTRAGVMWYIHKVTREQVGELFARREAEEIGPSDPKFWLAADAYIASVKPAPAPAPAITPKAPTPAPAPAPALLNPSASKADSKTPPAPSAGPPPARSADNDNPRDPGSWKPLAAVVVTGLSIPLAYMGRSIPGGMISLARASLPGPRQSPKSLPGGSDG